MSLEIIEALLAGAFIGSVLGFIGAGGAMLAVPILIYIFQFTPHHATTASLAVVGLAAASGVISKIRSREILYREAIIIWAIGLATNLGFSSISDQLPDRFITTGFALVLALAGISMLRNPLSAIHTRMPLPILIIVSLLIGSITGLFGIGRLLGNSNTGSLLWNTSDCCSRYFAIDYRNEFTNSALGSSIYLERN